MAFAVECLGFIPDLWQERALRATRTVGQRVKRVSMQACAGPGKAMCLNAYVPTPAGERRWGDLRAGDLLFAQDGSPTRIVRRTADHEYDYYVVHFSDGSSLEVSSDHLWKVQGRSERRYKKNDEAGVPAGRVPRKYEVTDDYFTVMTTEEIIERGWTDPSGKRRDLVVPMQGPAQYPRAEQPLDPYLMGAWLGDGSKRSSRITGIDAEVFGEIERRGYTVTRGSTPAEHSVHLIQSGLREAGVFDCGSHERFIPEVYKHASVEQRMDLLRGLMDTDGTIGRKDGSISYCTTSERLAGDIIWLVRSMGGIARWPNRAKKPFYYDGDRERVGGRPAWIIAFAMPECPFLLSRKAERWSRPQDRYLSRWIEDIEPTGRKLGMCVEVDHPSSCYLAGDFIVTHNTALLAVIFWHRLLCFASPGEHPKGAALSMTWDNLRDNFWAELAKWQQRSELLLAAFHWSKERVVAKDHPETWFASARGWAKTADPTEQGRTLSGLHSWYSFLIIDESATIPVSVRLAAEQAMGDTKDGLICQAGNPTTQEGMLYHACVQERDKWYVISITADPDDPERTPRVDAEWAREQIQQRGRDDPWVCAFILGQFPPGGVNQLLTLEDVERAINRSPKPVDYEWAPKLLGVDVARMGLDSSIIFPRQGCAAFTPIRMGQVDSNVGAGAVARKWASWEADACFIDDGGGFGGAWADQLKRNLGFHPTMVSYNGKPDDPRFFNKRSEMWFKMAEWIKQVGALPDTDNIRGDLSTPLYYHKGDRLIIEPKDDIRKRLGRSPDEGDALGQTFAFDVRARGAGVQNMHELMGRYGEDKCIVEADPFWEPWLEEWQLNDRRPRRYP